MGNTISSNGLTCMTVMYLFNCSLRYSTNVDRVSKSQFAPHNINRYACSRLSSHFNTGALLLEPLHCRDGSSTLSNNISTRYRYRQQFVDVPSVVLLVFFTRFIPNFHMRFISHNSIIHAHFLQVVSC